MLQILAVLLYNIIGWMSLKTKIVIQIKWDNDKNERANEKIQRKYEISIGVKIMSGQKKD